MGLHDESIIPDEYYCEKCRPDFHKIFKPNNMYVQAYLADRLASAATIYRPAPVAVTAAIGTPPACPGFLANALNRSTKSSRYLPVLDGASRSAPLSAADKARMQDLKNKALQNTTRRATMNSRTAYDEDEALRRAIEESKADGTLGKRSRDDSEE